VDPIALAQAGPAAVLLFVLIALFRAVVRGDLVPGFIYRAEVEQRQKAETQAERNADALAALAKVAANGVPPGA
jgi:hypothetical protein